MARNTLAITENWQQIASGESIITITQKGKGTLYFNTQADEVNRLPSFPEAGDQAVENEARSVFCRTVTAGAGWEVLVDGAI